MPSFTNATPYINDTTATSAPSPLTTFIASNTQQPSSHASNTSPFPHHLHHLALQIQHNLQHQHSWTALTLHTHSPLSHSPLPRPLLSGIPPRRLYVHPDEQIALLKRKVRVQDVPAEREWVLPSHVREKWSLRGFAEVFDGVGRVPPGPGDGGVSDGDGECDAEGYESAKNGVGNEDNDAGLEDPGARQLTGDAHQRSERTGRTDRNKWREENPKRLLLATVCDDSTIVYYIIHDGLVKPRQN